jgi:hypothetical protein
MTFLGLAPDLAASTDVRSQSDLVVIFSPPKNTLKTLARRSYFANPVAEETVVGFIALSQKVQQY